MSDFCLSSGFILKQLDNLPKTTWHRLPRFSWSYWRTLDDQRNQKILRIVLKALNNKLPLIINMFKGELNPKIKFVLFERTFKITE